MTKVICKSAALLILLPSAALSCSAQTNQTQTKPVQIDRAYQYFRVGNTSDAQVKPQAGYALMGGGTDLDEAFVWLCARANGGDLLVLRATGTDEYNEYIQKLCHLNSVATLVIPNRDAANDPFVEKKIRSASAIFISGGDQSNYIRYWEHSPVQTALNDEIARGVPLGGTSAGLAVMGDFSYTAMGDKPDEPNLDGKTALMNPLSPRISLDRGFLRIPILEHIITDTHFAKRDRMGRLLVFLARICSPSVLATLSLDPEVRGIGVEERAAVLLEPDGHAKVVGNGSAYFIHPGMATSNVPPDPDRPMPLTYGPYAVQKVASGQTFNLKSWTGSATAYSLSVKDGTIHSTQAGGAIY